ncbi:MAG TPA: hypothetical protein VEF34_08180 [Syntrophobacteraceae bacterium]|nr:hypothetical protein [Syntrophobacteraceae bacterium]
MKNQISQSLDSSSRFNSIVRLDSQTAWCVLAACALMKRLGKIQGVEQHWLFNRLLDAHGEKVRSEGDLRSWMFAAFPALNSRLWDTCRKQANGFLEAGIGVFRRRAAGGHSSPSDERHSADILSQPLRVPPSPCPSLPCPAVLFGKGSPSLDLPLLAVFNSRKPRLVSPDSRWFEALRFFFRCLDSREIAVAGSTGTLTYDLASALASRCGLAQLAVAPFPVQAFRPAGIPALSCMLDSATCSKGKTPICRDRIVAALASFHLVLEIRAGGNLLAVLEEIQAKSPRREFIFDPGAPDSSNAGNYALLRKFPEHACAFKLPGPPDSTSVASLKNKKRLSAKNGAPLNVGSASLLCAGGNYLFHYTRACAGPWPGQTYRQYLLDLLDRHPLSGHSALDALIRILQEATIRAGAGIVRGREAVICWSSHPPHELFLMRKWNRALVRWTVEPYGIAVRRDILRSLGAKPAVYGSDRTWSRLGESERYRFQLSGSTPSASWRHEREWRLRGDLPLGKINAGFVFVQTEEEKARVSAYVNSKLPIVVLKRG